MISGIAVTEQMHVDVYARLSTYIAKSDTSLSHNPGNQRVNCHNNYILAEVLRHGRNAIHAVEQMVEEEAFGLKSFSRYIS